MRNRKQFILAASVSALIGATAWAQVPRGDAMYGDSTRYRSQAEPLRDSTASDAATTRQGVTASDQTNNKGDVEITTKIRREIMGKKGMSINGQNVKIVTIDGKVILKGMASSASEKKTIEQIAIGVAGKQNVTNELLVK